MFRRFVARFGSLALFALGPLVVAFPAAAAPGSNVLIISLDTLRADRLGCYGYDRPTSPALDAFAADATRFDRMYSESTWTLPTHMTLFTGLFPSSHGVVRPEHRLPEGITTLAEILQSEDYKTYAVTDGGYVDSHFGFGRGFDRYEEREKEFRSTLFLAKNFLATVRDDENFLLFLHTYDIHCPYDPPAEYAEMFRTRPPEDHLEVTGKCGNPDFNSRDLTPGQVRFLSDQYDAGIRAVDDLLGDFLAYLEDEGWLEDTIVVITSDHGEQFWEHGRIGHGYSLYWETIQIPCIVRAPGVPPGVVTGGTGLVDVMPTLLDLLGLSAPFLQGESRVAAMTDPSRSAVRPIYQELDRFRTLRSVVRGDTHVIQDRDTGAVEVFDLSPDLRPPPAAGPTEVSAELEAWLVAHEKGLIPPADVPTGVLTSEQVERLRALGYVD